MQSWHRPVETNERGLRWGLPWICVLATSASIAYAMTVAVAIGPSAGNSPTTITVAQAPANGSATSDLAQVPLGDPAVDPPAGTLVVVSTGTPGSIGPFAGCLRNRGRGLHRQRRHVSLGHPRRVRDSATRRDGRSPSPRRGRSRR